MGRFLVAARASYYFYVIGFFILNGGKLWQSPSILLWMMTWSFMKCCLKGFGKYGIECDFAKSAEEARELLSNAVYDLVIW